MSLNNLPRICIAFPISLILKPSSGKIYLYVYEASFYIRELFYLIIIIHIYLFHFCTPRLIDAWKSKSWREEQIKLCKM